MDQYKDAASSLGGTASWPTCLTGIKSSGTTAKPRCANTNPQPGMSIACARKASRSSPGPAACPRHSARPGRTVRSRASPAYSEYDAVPGNCQAAATKKMPRAGLSPHAGGHTDPHSALGIGALGGALAAKAVMQAEGIKGTIVLFGEPAEKLRLSKPVHAAKGYYDKLDAAISFHPTLHAAAGQYRALGHPLRRWLRWHLHVRMRGAGRRGSAAILIRRSRHPMSRRGRRARPMRCSTCSRLTKQTQSNMLPFTQGLVAERGDPDGGAGDGRQPAGADRGDPVSVAHPDHRDGGAGRAGAGQQCRGGGEGGALHLEAGPG